MKLRHCLLPFIVMLVIAGSTSTCDKKQKPEPTTGPTWVGTYDSSGCRFIDAGNLANLDQKLVMECLPTDDAAGTGGVCE